MPENRIYAKPDPTPMYVCLALSILVCGWFFMVGFTCVTVWFYKGALGPVPEKFVIVPLHRKKKAQVSLHALATGVEVNNKRATAFPHIAEVNKRKTVFPHVAEPHAPIANPFSDDNAIPGPQPYFATIPAINVEVMDEDVDEGGVSGYEEFQSPDEVRRYIAEERRISRLPAFEQDDCGDGTEFPSVSYATDVAQSRRSHTDATKAYFEYRMTKDHDMRKWLTVSERPDEIHYAREKLLDHKQPECVQIRPDGEAGSEELLVELVQRLRLDYPERFNVFNKFGKRHIKDRASLKDFCLVRPFENHPIDLCARLAGADFNIFVKDMFTRKWYLQACATTFPAGWHMSKHIGKSLDAIINSPGHPMRLWLNLPPIIDDISTSPSSLFSRTSTFIQTLPANPRAPQLHNSLFTQRPMDLFSGNIGNLVASNLHVRREFQTFRVLPKSGAVVMSTRTEIWRLIEVNDMKGKQKLMEEIDQWTDEEATFKGRDLWINAVTSWCEGGSAFRDDVTVMGDV